MSLRGGGFRAVAGNLGILSGMVKLRLLNHVHHNCIWILSSYRGTEYEEREVQNENLRLPKRTTPRPEVLTGVHDEIL